jgi:TPR repeat protein
VSRALKSALLPIGGAVLAIVLALGGTLAFLTWRAGEQRRVLDRRSASCSGGDRTVCDELRGMCLKRSGDACVALAEAYLAAGPARDVAEGMRLLDEGCTYRHGAACLRAGRMRLDGVDVARDEDTARARLDRGCDLGARESCALRQTLK